jgi:hypothetical protein
MLRREITRHVPWWLVLVLGVGWVVLGGVLTAEPFLSLSVLAWLVAAALLATGVSELAAAGVSLAAMAFAAGRSGVMAILVTSRAERLVLLPSARQDRATPSRSGPVGRGVWLTRGQGVV